MNARNKLQELGSSLTDKRPPRKHRKPKPDEVLPPIEGDFDLVCCDLSFRRPGFARLRYCSATRTVILLRKGYVNNKHRAKGKAIGAILNEIAEGFRKFISTDKPKIKVIVRERGFTQFNAETHALFKVVGVIDMITWKYLEMSFQELTPKTVKLNVTGSGSASKEEVAEAIDNYCPDHTQFVCDDESDAMAVGIAWLVKNGYLDLRPLPKYAGQEAKKK